MTKCDLTSSSYSWLIQFILGALSFSSLLFKKYTEKPRRTWKVWFFDVSKQGFSQMLLHFANIFWAETLDGDPCVWYFNLFFVDSVFGTFINYILLMGVERAVWSKRKYRFKSGYYGKPPSWRNWVWQSLIWLAIIALMKCACMGLCILLQNPLNATGPIQSSERLQLIFIMIIIPVILNTIMFWVTDNFLKVNKEFMRIEQSTIDNAVEFPFSINEEGNVERTNSVEV